MDFAIRVFTIALACTLPTKIAPLLATKPVLNLCIASLRVLAIFAWIALTRRFLRARCAPASAASCWRYVPDASFVPSEHVAAVFSPRSIPITSVPSDFCGCTFTHTFRYQRPRASCANDPAFSSNFDKP